jgi:hypothetical protein
MYPAFNHRIKIYSIAGVNIYSWLLGFLALLVGFGSFIIAKKWVYLWWVHFMAAPLAIMLLLLAALCYLKEDALLFKLDYIRSWMLKKNLQEW